MKHKWIRLLTSLALVFGIVLSLALDGSAASVVDLEEKCSLSVWPGSEEMKAELEEARVNVVYDLYKVADAVKISGSDGYTYDACEPYRNLGITAPKAGSEEEAAKSAAYWEVVAQDAARIALKEHRDTPVKNGIAADGSTKAGDLNAGLYLLVARGADTTDYVTEIEVESSGGAKENLLVTVAQSAAYTYTFAPVLVSLPGKAADENGIISSAGPGDWLYNVDVVLKPEKEERFGSLEIKKILKSYKDPATFVFDVKAVLNGKTIYSDVVALTFTQAEEKSVLLNNIPVGAEVTVKEIYSGASYSLVSGSADTIVLPIKVNETATATFINDYNGKQIDGHGIVNRYSYDEAAGGWVWSQVGTNTPTIEVMPGSIVTPDNSGTTDNTETPDNGGTTDNTETPDNGGTPDNTETPDNSETPDNTMIPDNNETTDNTETPDNNETPDNTITPEATAPDNSTD